MIFIVIAFLICSVNGFLLTLNTDLLIAKKGHFIIDEQSRKNEQSFEFSDSGIPATVAVLKIEKVTVASPVSFNPVKNRINNINLQIKRHSRKQFSLISQSDLVVSKTLNLSSIITKLQI